MTEEIWIARKGMNDTDEPIGWIAGYSQRELWDEVVRRGWPREQVLVHKVVLTEGLIGAVEHLLKGGAK